MTLLVIRIFTWSSPLLLSQVCSLWTNSTSRRSRTITQRQQGRSCRMMPISNENNLDESANYMYSSKQILYLNMYVNEYVKNV